MDVKVKAFSEYERYKKERIGKPFKLMGDADWFKAGFLAASSTSSNSDYEKCKIESEIKRLEENPEGDYVTRISALEWALRIIAGRYVKGVLR